MSLLVSILFAVILFSFLIFVHELGHFLAAKLSGVQVNEFSMFMGPAIASWTRGTTRYTIRCIPIGGYCAMEGEEEDTESPHSFQKASWWKRFIILAAGSFMNFISGVLIVAVVLFFQPGYTTTELALVEDWSTAAVENGLQTGDQILEFDGKRISIYEDFYLATMLAPDGNYDMTVLRNGEEVELKNVPMIRQLVANSTGGQTLLYGFKFAVNETTAASVPARILPTALYYVKSVVVGLESLFSGQAGWQDMTGAVGIVQIMSESAAEAKTTGLALLSLLNFGGFLAINLAVMNVLPVPALDGGRIVGLLLTTGIESVTRKKINPKFESYIHAAGMILLLALMALITFKDIIVIFKR